MKCKASSVVLLIVLLEISAVAEAGEQLSEKTENSDSLPIISSTKDVPSASPKPDYILSVCQETEQVSTIFGHISPKYTIINYIQNRDRHPVELTSVKNVTVIKLPIHGKLISSSLYIPEPNYFGKDKVLFMAEFEGKRYKIILDIHVVVKVDEGDSPTTTCPPPKLIKVDGK